MCHLGSIDWLSKGSFPCQSLKGIKMGDSFDRSNSLWTGKYGLARSNHHSQAAVAASIAECLIFYECIGKALISSPKTRFVAALELAVGLASITKHLTSAVQHSSLELSRTIGLFWQFLYLFIWNSLGEWKLWIAKITWCSLVYYCKSWAARQSGAFVQIHESREVWGETEYYHRNSKQASELTAGCHGYSNFFFLSRSNTPTPYPA